jgi:hypothetical protein
MRSFESIPFDAELGKINTLLMDKKAAITSKARLFGAFVESLKLYPYLRIAASVSNVAGSMCRIPGGIAVHDHKCDPDEID